MSFPVIQIDRLVKTYQLGTINHGTLKADLVSWWARLRGRPDPNSVVDALSGADHVSARQIVALREIDLSVAEQEVLGIIGPNGAGKSTLLKIISRITRPTSGTVRLVGSVASLLEVGTGFHPELTGRDNVYLNGAILGMSRTRIRQRFQDIVDFSGVGAFIDTPVKRYSSGMYVRLAFAVAAHLDPDVLVVDEVLAVGDAAFQQQCLGKMDDVNRQGRTVLIVSHNMALIRKLCSRVILISGGQLVADGPAEHVIPLYLETARAKADEGAVEWPGDSAPGCAAFRLRAVRLLDTRGDVARSFDLAEPIEIEIAYETTTPLRGVRINLHLLTTDGVVALASTDHNIRPSHPLEPGTHRSRCTIPPFLLNQGQYQLKIQCGIPGQRVLVRGQEFLSFTTFGSASHGSFFPESWPGVVAPRLHWKLD